MNAHLREFNFDDLLTVCRGLPDSERVLWKTMTGYDYDPVAAAMTYFRANGSHHVIHDGVEPVACAGFIEQRPGVFRTWMLATDRAWVPHGRDMTLIVGAAIRDIIEQGVAHRVETITLADRERALDWYPKIGLQYESTQPGYGINGEDAVVYVALRGERNA